MTIIIRIAPKISFQLDIVKATGAFFLFLDPIIHVIGYLSIYIQATRILIDGFYRLNSFVSHGLCKYNSFAG